MVRHVGFVAMECYYPPKKFTFFPRKTYKIIVLVSETEL